VKKQKPKRNLLKRNAKGTNKNTNSDASELNKRQRRRGLVMKLLPPKRSGSELKRRRINKQPQPSPDCSHHSYHEEQLPVLLVALPLQPLQRPQVKASELLQRQWPRLSLEQRHRSDKT